MNFSGDVYTLSSFSRSGLVDSVFTSTADDMQFREIQLYHLRKRYPVSLRTFYSTRCLSKPRHICSNIPTSNSPPAFKITNHTLAGDQLLAAATRCVSLVSLVRMLTDSHIPPAGSYRTKDAAIKTQRPAEHPMQVRLEAELLPSSAPTAIVHSSEFRIIQPDNTTKTNSRILYMPR